jgi:DNA-binding CsgD family transcriptional regulator
MESTQRGPAVLELFDQLLSADDESDVAHCVRTIVSTLGAESYVFVSLNPAESLDSRSSHRFLIGCRPEWCQLYNANKWFMTDPFLDYSLSNTEPIFGSQVEVTTQGQKDMLASAHENGFRSGFVVPVHTSDKGRIGVLYLGSEKSEAEGEKILSANRMYFRALAMELLDWSIRIAKREIMESRSITGKDLQVVSYLKNGFTAEDIAREMDVSVQTIYGNYRKIKDKVGASHISEVVKFAEVNGLLI